MNTDDRALADEIAFTSKLLEKEIEKTGTMESFMIRAGLLRSILAVAADRLEAFHAKPVVGEALELLRQAMNALGCADKNDPLEPIADNGMTVWDGMKAESERLWQHYRKLLAPVGADRSVSPSDNERRYWLIQRLLYGIQQYVYSDATAGGVAEVFDSLGESDGFDPNVATIVRIPKWLTADEAQDAVDAALQSPPPVVHPLAQMVAIDEEIEAKHPGWMTGEPPVVSGEVYEAAVKGRQDFRRAYRDLLPIQRAAAKICLLWRSPLSPFQVPDDFADAVNELDMAVSGGGPNSAARPKLQALAPPVVEEGRREAAIDRALVLAVEDAIDGPPHSYGPEPMEVREYRGQLYRIWSPLRDAILALTPAEGVGMREALERIANWEMPETGQFWDKERTQPMSYGACYGSNGERDHIISIAKAALSTPATAQGDVRDDLWSLEQRLTDGEFFSDYDKDLRLLGVFRRFLATLGTPHEG